MPKISAQSLLTLLWVFVFILLGNCKASENNTTGTTLNFEEVVRAKLGPGFIIEHNVDNQYALCQQKREEGDHLRRVFKYLVVQLKDNKILHEGAFVLGYAKWSGPNHIEVATTLEGNEKTDVKKIAINSEL
jgi:hypothetical protein